MGADRLVSILLMLQRRGQVTATMVATELEVSERTARRDLDALGRAGIPIYSVQGRGGGWRLAGGGKTDLSGFSAEEARALFLLAGPRAATPQVKAALRKLMRALPEPLRERAEAASAAVVVDATQWDRRNASPRTPPHLDDVQHAVIDGEQIRLGYSARDGTSTDRVVHPLGVVAKGSTWYLIAHTATGMRTFRVDRVTSVEPTGAKVVKPDGFDLAETWRETVDRVDRMRAPIAVVATADATALGLLRMVFGNRLAVGGDGDVVSGRVEVQLRGHTIRSLAAEVAGFGALVEILEPVELRAALAEIGRELIAGYG